jgi:hypothetical protein
MRILIFLQIYVAIYTLFVFVIVVSLEAVQFFYKNPLKSREKVSNLLNKLRGKIVILNMFNVISLVFVISWIILLIRVILINSPTLRDESIVWVGVVGVVGSFVIYKKTKKLKDTTLSVGKRGEVSYLKKV